MHFHAIKRTQRALKLQQQYCVCARSDSQALQYLVKFNKAKHYHHGALQGGGLLLRGGEVRGQPGRRRPAVPRQGDVRGGRPGPLTCRQPPRPRLRPLRGARDQVRGGRQHAHRRVPRAQGELPRQG
jgi:hypothetical protein